METQFTLRRGRAAQDIGRHERSVLRENMGQVLDVLTLEASMPLASSEVNLKTKSEGKRPLFLLTCSLSRLVGTM